MECTEVIHHVPCVLVSYSCHNKVAQSGWLGQQECMVSQFWRSGVQDQAVTMVDAFCRL